MKRTLVALVAAGLFSFSTFAEEPKPSEKDKKKTPETTEATETAAKDPAKEDSAKQDKASKKGEARTVDKKPADSPLVRAARKSRESEKKAKIAITDETVRNSKGKLTILPEPRELGEVSGEAGVTLANYEAARKAWMEQVAVALRELQTAEAAVTTIENRMRQVEQTYYEESDPDMRAGEIEKSFREDRKRLEAAKAAVEAARKHHAEILAREPRLP